MAQAQNQKVTKSLWAKIVAKAWKDPNFKSKLIRDPSEALKEFGVVVPAGVGIRVVENTEDTVHFVLPANATTAPNPTDSDLEQFASKVMADFTNCTKYIPIC